jgi:ATP-binding cassette subfamily C protein
LEMPTEIDETKTPHSLLKGNIEVNNISFRYNPEAPLILDGISLKISAGEFVAFVGPSGAGKSTILKLLLGLETPEQGSVFYDNQDISNLRLRDLRKDIGIVTQNAMLIPGTIFENIVGSAPFTMEEAWEAAEKAGLKEDIESFPMGMNTFVAEGCGTFSGGQRQRLIIARAIIKNPGILLLDEATSALDNRTQAIISRSLDQMKITRVVIAHRLSTIQNADRIYVVNKGKIVESGSFDELVKNNGLFTKLVQRQVI